MNKIRRLVLLMQAVLGFALTPAPAQTPTPAEPTPTPTLGDRFTQVLQDRRVVFRFFAPKANAVDVVIGLKSGPLPRLLGHALHTGKGGRHFDQFRARPNAGVEYKLFDRL